MSRLTLAITLATTPALNRTDGWCKAAGLAVLAACCLGNGVGARHGMPWYTQMLIIAGGLLFHTMAAVIGAMLTELARISKDMESIPQEGKAHQ